MSLFDTSIIAYSTKDCYILSILTKRAKLPKIKNFGNNAASEQSISESTLFIKRNLVYSKIYESYFTCKIVYSTKKIAYFTKKLLKSLPL